jgi:hypothetical protein
MSETEIATERIKLLKELKLELGVNFLREIKNSNKWFFLDDRAKSMLLGFMTSLMEFFDGGIKIEEQKIK